MAGKNAKKKGIRLAEKLAGADVLDCLEAVRNMGLAAAIRRLNHLPTNLADMVVSAINAEIEEFRQAETERVRHLANDCRAPGSRRISRTVRDITEAAMHYGVWRIERTAFGCIEFGKPE